MRWSSSGPSPSTCARRGDPAPPVVMVGYSSAARGQHHADGPDLLRPGQAPAWSWRSSSPSRSWRCRRAGADGPPGLAGPDPAGADRLHRRRVRRWLPTCPLIPAARLVAPCAESWSPARPHSAPPWSPASAAGTRCWPPTRAGRRRPDARRHRAPRLGRRAGRGRGALGRARRPGQQRRRRRRRAARRRHPRRVAVDHRDQPVRPVAGHRTFVPCSSGSARGTWSTSPRWPVSCTRPGWPPTTRVKAAVALTETSGHELWGVRASVVCPSYFRTDLVASMQGRDEAAGGVIAQAGGRCAARARRHRRGGARRHRRGRRGDPARRRGARGVRPEGRRPAGVRRLMRKQAGSAEGAVTDESVAVREEDAFDVGRDGGLALGERRAGVRRGRRGVREVRQFPGGAST